MMTRDGLEPSAAEVEREVLTTDAGRALLEEVAAVVAPRPSDVSRWRRSAPQGLVAAALRLAEGRRRGAARFTRADRMWFDPTGLEQATAEPVARHKAARFAGRTVVDLCCGIGGDALALAATARGVVAVDRDAGMALRTRWNVGVHGGADRTLVVRGDAGRFPLPPGAAVHIDPDRRASSGRVRARRVGAYEPGPDRLLALLREAPAGAIKLGPASDFEALFNGPEVEIELTSLGGECKEATVWFGRLVSCRRRATALPSGASWTDRDGPDGARPAAGPVGAWVFDPDPALVRSGLLDGFAVAHGLARVAPAIDWLTGPERVGSPWLSAFAVEEVLPADLKRLRRLVSTRGLGPLEIKTRGLDLRPEALRTALRPGGARPASLLLFGGPGPARAILAHRDAGA